jgi:EAL domain-containing protein (putative c-di-GMP-specific phosphodiesterase class I)
MTDPARARRVLTELADMGATLSIDDFGTGYSSLAQLEFLPVDVLKIDRQFVAEIVPGGARAGLVSAIVTLAQTMGLRVIAEGVETPVQRQLLLRLGCSYGQGYLWSRPLPAEKFTTSLWQFAPEVATVAAGSRRREHQQ